MPDYEQKDMDGVAFKNDRKSEDWHADWSGHAMIEGSMYWVSVYDNVSKGGKEYRKLRFKPQNGASLSEGGTKFGVTAAEAKKDDDIPW